MKAFYTSKESRDSSLDPTDAELAARAAANPATRLFPLNGREEVRWARPVPPVAEAAGMVAVTNGTEPRYTQARLAEIMQDAVLHPIDFRTPQQVR